MKYLNLTNNFVSSTSAPLLVYVPYKDPTALYYVELQLFMADSKNKCLAIFHLQDTSLTQKLLVLYGTDNRSM